MEEGMTDNVMGRVNLLMLSLIVGWFIICLRMVGTLRT